MAKDRNWSLGDRKVFLIIAAAAFAIGLLLSISIFPPAHAQNAFIDLKATVPDVLPQQPVQTPEPQMPQLPFAAAAQPASDDDLIALLQMDSAPVIPHALPAKERWQTVRMQVTGYCACSKCCGQFADGITACNHHIQKGDAFVAADKFYSFGTEMVIPGYNSDKPVKVMDRGGAIKGKHLDLFFHSHQQAQQWGVQYLDVQIKID